MMKRMFPPSEILNPFVAYYYAHEEDGRAENLQNRSVRVYPHGNVVLVIHYEQPFLFSKKGEIPQMEPRSVICGQQTSYYDLAPSGKSGMIFILFRPAGAGVFFDFPMTEITDMNIAFEDIGGAAARELEDKIRNAADIHERVRIIDGYLLRRLVLSRGSDLRMNEVMRKIHRDSGRIFVRELAHTACLSVKQFERRFAAQVGLKPKQYLRITRFQNILQHKRSGCFDYDTELAHACGYYDQSHMIRDFKDFTDMSPRDFFSPVNQSI